MSENFDEADVSLAVEANEEEEIAALRAENEALRKDAERLDWIIRQGDEFSLRLIIDAPGDGEYYCNGAFSDGQGKTPKDAIDEAMKK